MSVYKIIELVGTSENSWEDAAKAAVEKAGQSLRDLRIAEVSMMDMKVENGKIIIPLNDIKKEKFVSFTYNGNNGTVPLLAYISEEGKVITAISMCEPCNSTTFHIKSNELVCNSCGTTWEIDNLEAISGSCGKYPPDPIPSIVVGDEVQINEHSVTNWRRRI